jgi:protein-S-isoprenylcysteine O-methyltransferase Ste14
MRNFIPTLICFVALFFVAVKDSTYNVAPPYSWYDVVGCLAVVALIVSFIWGIVQQSSDNDSRRSATFRAARQGVQTTPPKTTATNKSVPLDPPKRK